MTTEILIELDERRRVSLGKLGRHQRYLAHEEPDGTLVFMPATVMSEAQARLLANPELMGLVDRVAADPAQHTDRRPRPRKRDA